MIRDAATSARATLERHLAAGYGSGFVGLVGTADEAEIILVGRPSLESAQPMRRDNIFRIASMTKAVIALATLMLVEEGRLSLKWQW